MKQINIFGTVDIVDYVDGELLIQQTITQEMAAGKKSFVMYAEHKEIFDQLPDEIAGKLIKHLFAYVNDEDPQTDDAMLKLAFTPIKQALKRDLKKYEQIKEARSAAGRKGGRPAKDDKAKKANGFSEKQTEAKKAVNVNVNDNDNVNVNVNVRSLEIRKADFKKSLHPFIEKYGKQMIEDFFNYWAQHNENGRKMHFEKQKTFQLANRLSTWHKKQKDYDTRNNNTGTKSPNGEKESRADKLGDW